MRAVVVYRRLFNYCTRWLVCNLQSGMSESEGVDLSCPRHTFSLSINENYCSLSSRIVSAVRIRKGMNINI